MAKEKSTLEIFYFFYKSDLIKNKIKMLTVSLTKKKGLLTRKRLLLNEYTVKNIYSGNFCIRISNVIPIHFILSSQ